jgi:hypothetical protein
VGCGKIKKKGLIMATLVARNANVAMVALTVGYGGVCSLKEYGVRRSVLCWYVWQEPVFRRSEDVFTYDLVNKEIV